MTHSRTKFGRRLHIAILGALLTTAISLFTSGSALAQPYIPHEFENTFDGSTSPDGPFEGSVWDVGVDQQTGSVYVLTTQTGLKLYKFNATGEPSPFTDPSLGGSNVLTVGATEYFTFGGLALAVDNSGGPHQGRVYVSNQSFDEHVWAFEPSGAPVGGNYPLELNPGDISVNPDNGNLFMSNTPLLGRVYEYTPEGAKTGVVVDLTQHGAGGESFESGPDGKLFAFNFEEGIQEFNLQEELLRAFPALYTSFEYSVDQSTGDVYSNVEEESRHYDPEANEFPPLHYGAYGTPKGLAFNGVNHYIYIARPGSVEIQKPKAPVTLPDVKVEKPSGIEGTSVTLNGIVNPDGVDTSECAFEYTTEVYFGGQYPYEEHSVPCDQGPVLSGSADVPVSATLHGLTKGGTYHYRLSVGNANGAFRTFDHVVQPSDPPVVENVYVDEVHADSVTFHAEVGPEGAPTTFHVLYGTVDCVAEPANCKESSESSSVGGVGRVSVSTTVTGLEQGTKYHYVLVATNQSAVVPYAQQTFTTFPYNPVLEDKCANAHVRQQTGAALLADCRAYELVSAAVARYNVESYLTPEEEPFGGYPYAESPTRVLYGVHNGAIPGTGHPTNHGLDPYVATRGANGWSTSYVGIPADLPYSTESFASPVLAADSALDTFAFGGQGLCSPCFSDGTTGIPVGRPDGSLVQGMQGTLSPGPAASPDMLVVKPVSADGTHLVFGSTSEFEGSAGSPAIYDRDLASGVTHAVSKLPGGGNIPCLMNCSTNGLAELDVSADGSRIVIGQLISTDLAGNHYWHLYMNLGDPTKTVDLTPGATHGALYDGMTQDGTTAYFTTDDTLTVGDSDTSADLYRAQVSPGGAVLSLVSVGSGAGNMDGCDPLPNSVNEHWNTPGPTANCGIVAVGGGGGIAAGDGTVYFASPELLDGSTEPEDGSADQPNLYIVRPGSSPQFVATLESSATGPHPSLEEHRFKRYFGQTSFPHYVAVDNSGGPSDGDVYVADTNEQAIRKYDPEGNLITSWKSGGKFEPELSASFSGIGVGPGGTLYVAIEEYFNDGNQIIEFNESGTQIGQTSVGMGPAPIGIAVSNDGWVFFLGYYAEVYGYKKGVGVKQIGGNGVEPVGLAVGPNTESLYVNFGGNQVGRYNFIPGDPQGRTYKPDGTPCTPKSIFFGCEPTEYVGAGEVINANGLYVDPTRKDLYVDEGNRILRFESNNKRGAGPNIGGKALSNSTSVAVSSSGQLYATNSGSEGANVAQFGPLLLAPDTRTDSPILIHSVNDSATRHTGDFQITPDGDDAVFTSTRSLTGYTNFGHGEIFRNDAGGGGLDCVSCNPTGAKANAEAELASSGLSLTDDGGTVFFNSSDPLVPSDLDNREDAFEWRDGKITLISTGLSPYDSSLLTGSADGTDAYFFTRDTLVPEDLNGSLVKIYDARAGGGFPYTPPPVSCKAADECHGAGSPPPAPQGVNTITGSGGNHVAEEGKCAKGKVRRKGHCVRKHHRKHRHGKKRSGKKQSRNGSTGGQG